LIAHRRAPLETLTTGNRRNKQTAVAANYIDRAWAVYVGGVEQNGL
jgi:hypothetical protein